MEIGSYSSLPTATVSVGPSTGMAGGIQIEGIFTGVPLVIFASGGATFIDILVEEPSSANTNGVRIRNAVVSGGAAYLYGGSGSNGTFAYGIYFNPSGGAGQLVSNQIFYAAGACPFTLALCNAGINLAQSYFAWAAIVLPILASNLTNGILWAGPSGNSPRCNAYYDGTGLASDYRISTGSHFFCNSGTPTATNGTGSGTTPTVTFSGSDAAMNLQILTGTSPSTSATIITLAFAKSWTSTPVCIIQPTTYVTQALQAATGTFVTSTVTTAHIVMTSGITALTGATTYNWRILCAE